MPKYPSIPIFPDAFLADTMHLSNDEFGIYVKLLFAAWRRPNCDLPDDDAFLAKTVGVDRRKWARIRPVMLAFHSLKPVDNPVDRPVGELVWTQKRLQKERKYVADHSEKQRAIALARWNKNNDLTDASAMPDRCQIDAPTPNPTPESESSLLSRSAPARSNSMGKARSGFPAGNGKDHSQTTVKNPDERIARFQRWLVFAVCKSTGKTEAEAWEMIAVATNLDHPHHFHALRELKAIALANGKGWPHNWPKQHNGVPSP